MSDNVSLEILAKKTPLTSPRSPTEWGGIAKLGPSYTRWSVSPKDADAGVRIPVAELGGAGTFRSVVLGEELMSLRALPSQPSQGPDWEGSL